MEIVNTYTETISMVWLALIALGMGGLSLFTAIVAIGDRDAIGWLFGMGAIILITLGILILSSPTTTRVYHEVIVSDYNAIDFEKYEIVEHKGKIVVLKELPQNED